MTADELRQLIQEGVPDALVNVQSEDNVHFDAMVVSEIFEGKSRVARHQSIYAILGERLGNEIHAFSLRTLTPNEQ